LTDDLTEWLQDHVDADMPHASEIVEHAKRMILSAGDHIGDLNSTDTEHVMHRCLTLAIGEWKE
jgi:hypothetical protein